VRRVWDLRESGPDEGNPSVAWKYDLAAKDAVLRPPPSGIPDMKTYVGEEGFLESPTCGRRRSRAASPLTGKGPRMIPIGSAPYPHLGLSRQGRAALAATPIGPASDLRCIAPTRKPDNRCVRQTTPPCSQCATRQSRLWADSRTHGPHP
jgi:hypothetical protein